MRKLLQNLFLLLFLSSNSFAQSDTECIVSNFPYQLNLNELSIPNLPDCTSSYAVGSSNDWSTTNQQGDFSFDGNSLKYSYSTVNNANAWFFTNGFLLEEGSSYKLIYTYASENPYFFERLRVSYGTEANLSSMTNEIEDHLFNSKETEEQIIEIESTEVYYFGFQAHSIANQSNIYLGDISIELVSDDADNNDPCLISSIPYELEVTDEDAYSLPECTSTENLGNGNQWMVTPFFGDHPAMSDYTITYTYNIYAEPANTWFYTHPLQLEAGVHYELSYQYEGSANWPEKMKVAVGADNNHEAMSQILADHNNIDSYDNNEVVFQVAEDGVYYIGFHAYSNANMNYLYLDNIRLDYAQGCFPVSDLSAGQEDENTVLLSWTASAESDHWEVKYASTGFNPETEGTSIEVQDTSEVSIIGLETGEAYDFYVRTICGEESSQWTSLLDFELENLNICEAPSNIQITGEGYGEFNTGDGGDSYVEFSWTANNGETAWEVSYVHLGYDNQETIIEVYDIPEVRIEGLIVDSMYEIKFRALCSNDNYSEWTTITYATPPGAGIDDEIFKDFSFYPNPTIDIIHFNSDLLINKIIIYNLIGQKLKELNISKTDYSLNVSDLANGQYLLQVEIEGYKKAFKILKN